MIQRVARPVAPTAPQAAQAPAARGKARFSLDSARPGPAGSAAPQPMSLASRVGRVIGDLEQQRVELDRMVQQAARGRSFSPGQLLLLQSKVYRYSQEMEVVSRMVDRAVSSVKTLLNTQL